MTSVEEMLDELRRRHPRPVTPKQRACPHRETRPTVPFRIRRPGGAWVTRNDDGRVCVRCGCVIREVQ
jgi:hypothetical protein